MTIKIVGTAPLKQYRITCANRECLSILEFDESHIMVFEGYAGVISKIRCPKCDGLVSVKNADILPECNF